MKDITKNTVSIMLYTGKALGMLILSFSIAFCGGGGGDSGNGGDLPVPQTCEITGQTYNAGAKRCECPENQFLNADRMACVRSCEAGEIKPDNKDACEVRLSCTAPQVPNPADNTCIDSGCKMNEIVDTTVSPPGCITAAACQTTDEKFVNVDENACVSQNACTSTVGQVAKTDGNCGVCDPESDEYANIARNACINAAACTSTAGQVAKTDGNCGVCDPESDEYANIARNACINAAACTSTAGQVAKTDGNCGVCDPESDEYANIARNACINAAACTSTAGQVAKTDGSCEECMGATPIPNADQTACLADADGDGVADDNDACPNGEAGMPDGADNALTADPDMDGCKNSEDDDDDNDDVPDMRDAFPHDACASVDTDNDGSPDNVVDSCTTTLTADVDDDNDGLIEIATAAELNNMRHNLAGTSYKSSGSAADNFTGAPNVATGEAAPASVAGHCDMSTLRTIGGSMRDAYLCGYELVADIDFFGADGAMGGGDDVDLNGNTKGNFDPIAGVSEDDGFTARLHGNGHTISNLNIDITDNREVSNHTNDASLIRFCDGSTIRDLNLANLNIKGRRNIAGLCATADDSAVIRNVHIDSASIQGASGFTVRMGGLVGRLNSSSQVIGSSISGNVSNGGGGGGGDFIGGLVGRLNSSSRVIGSSSSGNVSDSGIGVDHMGGLVGILDSRSQVIGSSSSSNVSDGGDGNDFIGGLVGRLFNNASVIGSSSSGNVSDGGDGNDYMGGLVGQVGWAIVRDSFSSGSVCDGTTNTTFCDTAGGGDDNIGILIGYFWGDDGGGKAELYNSLGVGQTSGNGSDNVGFLGYIRQGNQSQIDAILTGNRFDMARSGGTAKAGRVPQWDHDSNGGTPNVDVTIADTLIVSGNTAATQVSSAFTGWSAMRWLFASGADPRVRYFNYDPANPTTDGSTADTTITVCETAGSDPMTDEGEAGTPDCGDVLSAFPRP